MACNSYSRTSYYDQIHFMFALPAILVVYVGVIRGVLWILRPALLYVRPQLKGGPFFDHKASERTSALCGDVRKPLAMPQGCICAPCLLVKRRTQSSVFFAAGCAWAH
jgi:hypothetical protein